MNVLRPLGCGHDRNLRAGIRTPPTSQGPAPFLGLSRPPEQELGTLATATTLLRDSDSSSPTDHVFRFRLGWQKPPQNPKFRSHTLLLHHHLKPPRLKTQLAWYRPTKPVGRGRRGLSPMNLQRNFQNLLVNLASGLGRARLPRAAFQPHLQQTTCLRCSQNPECSRKTHTQQLPRLVRPGNPEPLQLPSSVNSALAAALFLPA